MLINNAPINADGKVAIDAAAAIDSWSNGFPYAVSGALCVEDAPPTHFSNGFGFTDAQRLAISTDATVPNHAIGGIPLLDGRVKMDLTRDPTHWSGGWPIYEGIAQETPTFSVDFTDAGLGEVNITPTIGAGPATFTRSTVAHTELANGTLRQVGMNRPRCAYRGGVYLGFMSEDARTNLTLYSQELINPVYNPNATVMLNAARAPDGTMTADILTADAVPGVHGWGWEPQYPSSTAETWVASVYVKSNGIRYYEFAPNSIQGSRFDIVNGVVTHTYPGDTCWIEALADGWFRIAVKRVGYDAPNTYSLGFMLDDNEARDFTGDGVKGIHLWGHQREFTTSSYSSYISTSGTEATRAADSLTYPTAGNWDFAEGTAVADMAYRGAYVSGVDWRVIDMGLLFTNSGIAASYDGTTTVTPSPQPPGLAAYTVNRIANSWSAAQGQHVKDRNVIGAGPFDGAMGVGANFVVGRADGFGWVRGVSVYNKDLYVDARNTPRMFLDFAAVCAGAPPLNTAYSNAFSNLEFR